MSIDAGAIVTLCVLVSAVIFFLLYIRERGQKVREKIVYIDTSGVDKVPVKKYIDVHKNKTINIKMDEYDITISHLPIIDNIRYIERIAMIFYKICEQSEDAAVDVLAQKTKAVIISTLYDQLEDLIIQLALPHIHKNKKKFIKLFKRKSEESADFVPDIAEQVLDYWLSRKKKALLLARQTTLRQTDGESSSWSTYSMDMTGKKVIRPRYASTSSIQNIVAKKENADKISK